MYAMVFIHQDLVRVVKVYVNFDEAVTGAVTTVCASFDPENLEVLLRKHHRAYGFGKSVHIVEVTT